MLASLRLLPPGVQRPCRTALRVAALIAALIAESGCWGDQRVHSIGFNGVPDRVWIGPDLYANRLQDWRVNGGRLESVEGRSTKPMRTAHVLSSWLGGSDGDAVLTVELGPNPALSGDPATWAGFLVGAGGEHVDHRISALVHHWPAEDGGLIVAVDGRGELVVRDNSVNHGYRRPVGNIPTEAWPELEPVLREIFDSAESSRLVVRITPSQRSSDVAWEHTYKLVAELQDAADGRVTARSTYDHIASVNVDGNIALVSHGSPRGDDKGYWFRQIEMSGSKVYHDPSRALGPVLGAFHTVSDRVMKMTAQFGPLGNEDSRSTRLEIKRGGAWVSAVEAAIQDGSFTATFRVEDWDVTTDVPYRVAYDFRGSEAARTSYYEGVVRRMPSDKQEFVLAAMNCQNMSGGEGQWNHDHFWYPHAELVSAVAFHKPDMLFFAGDQIYEAGLEGVERTPSTSATLDYLNHWFRFVYAFRDLARDIPAVIIPDDHDVYHGNVWGNGGVRVPGDFSPPTDAGGYVMEPEWVNMVHRTQVSHLPDPVDPAPIANGITVYHTRMEYAGLSFAILADRMWKSPPVTTVPEARVWNGWPQAPGYDARKADVPGAQLLGARQLRFLDDWANDWSHSAWMKVVLSQTLFSNLATIPDSAASGAVLPDLATPELGAYQRGDKLADDMDSNGWPQSGRNEALRRMRRGFAFHIAGDQHLGSFVHYGIDDWNDAGNAFVVPSIANIWPRRWFPPIPGKNRDAGSPEYTGEFFDGFGNRMTVHAVANPVRAGVEPAALYDRSPGYGIIRFDRGTRKITSEAWPRWVDPSREDASQYVGWPVTVDQIDNYARKISGFLPQLIFPEGRRPVVQVVDERTGQPVYTIRVNSDSFAPFVFDVEASYLVRVHDTDEDAHASFEHVRATADTAGIRPTLTVVFDR